MDNYHIPMCMNSTSCSVRMTAKFRAAQPTQWPVLNVFSIYGSLQLGICTHGSVLFFFVKICPHGVLFLFVTFDESIQTSVDLQTLAVDRQSRPIKTRRSLTMESRPTSNRSRIWWDRFHTTKIYLTGSGIRGGSRQRPVSY